MHEKIEVGSPHFPEYRDIIHTPLSDIDRALGELQKKKDEWAALDVPERLAILDEIREDLRGVMHRWVAAGIHFKGLSPKTNGEGEEWIILYIAFRAVNLIRQSLIDIKKKGRPRIPGRIKALPSGQTSVRVFPHSFIDRILFTGITGEVWLEPGVSPDEVVGNQALSYRQKRNPGNVCAVLAAGNVSSLSVLDFIYKMFVENRVVALKTNPVNDYLAPIMDDAFQALVKRGYLKQVHGGVKEGSYLCAHPSIDSIHLTGSDKTFEDIVFGPGEEGARRKAGRKPQNTRDFTAELGNVTPAIIVPGPWSEKDLREQAVHLASWFVTNAGFNCLTPRVIIQHKGWDKREEFLRVFGEILEREPTRKAYYPGALKRHQAFLEEHPDARQFGEARGDRLPWTVVPDIDPSNGDDPCFHSEAFCGLVAETAIEASSTPEFLKKAAVFANENLWGTLCASIFIHPKSLRDPNISGALEEAISDLRYGSVHVNLRSEYGFFLMTAPWGGYPGRGIYDVQSGIGHVNNMLMIDRPQKSVIRGPFHRWPDPFALTAKRMDVFGRNLVEFESTRSLKKLPGLLWKAVRS